MLSKNPAMIYGAGAMGGLALAQYGVGRGNVALGGIGGFLAGGFGGMLLGGSSLLAGTALGAFAGPIGAGIGAIVGIILALRSRGRQKQQSAAVHEQYLAAQKQILEEFSSHRTDYDSAVGGLTAAYQQAVASLQGMGGPGRNTINEITGPYQDTLRKLQQIQSTRSARIGDIAGLPVPTFHSGSNGIIRNMGGAFPAILRNNEAVLNQRAAAALGDERIRALNSGSGGGGDTINIYANDAKSFLDMIRRNEGGFVRAVNRAARDRGKRAPL